jgi:hypothetical protein
MYQKYFKGIDEVNKTQNWGLAGGMYL